MSKGVSTFSFNAENIKKAQDIIEKYPEGKQKSAMLPLLDIAQRQNGGWLSVPVMEHVADLINEPYMRVYEVATFYSMLYTKPVGKHHIQVCGTTPCWLRGSHAILKNFEDLAKTKCGSTSEDSEFTVTEVECLGACRNAPVVQINDDFYEDLDYQKIESIMTRLKKK